MKPNIGRSLTGHLSAAHVNSHMQCLAHAVLCHGLEKLLSEQHGCSMAGTQHGSCESNMATLCKSNGKDSILTLKDMAWVWHGRCELASTVLMCVNSNGNNKQVPVVTGK